MRFGQLSGLDERFVLALVAQVLLELHSIIMAAAARPTAFMVSALNTNTSVTPRNTPTSTVGFISSTW
jgi:hypothetical protein